MNRPHDAETASDDPDAARAACDAEATNVVCGLCGQPVASADAECAERTFWLKEGPG